MDKESLNLNFTKYVVSKLEEGKKVKILGKCANDDIIYDAKVVIYEKNGQPIEKSFKATGRCILYAQAHIDENIQKMIASKVDFNNDSMEDIFNKLINAGFYKR